MIKPALTGFALAFAATAALAQGMQPTDFVQRHMAAAGKGDIDGIVADYADDAVTINGAQVTVGKPAIRQMFQGLFGPKPAAPAGAPAAPAMQVDKVWQEGDVGLVSWHRGEMKGTDAFVIKNGKIQSQSVFISGAPPAPPKS